MKKTLKFTLLELLIVIAIVMILASILMPALGKARETTKRIACTGTLKQLGLGLLMYSNDWNGFYPIKYQNANEYAWALAISDYMNYKHTGSAYYWGPAVYHCAAGTLYDPILAINRGYMASSYVVQNTYGNGRVTGQGKSNSQIVLFDAWWGGSISGRYTEVDVNCTLASNRDAKSIGATNYSYIANRHAGRFNYLIKDGSAHTTSTGVSGYGADPIWIIYTNGTYWKDGTIY